MAREIQSRFEDDPVFETELTKDVVIQVWENGAIVVRVRDCDFSIADIDAAIDALREARAYRIAREEDDPESEAARTHRETCPICRGRMIWEGSE